MSYNENKLLREKDGRKIIEVLDRKKADIIDVQIDTPASVMTFSDGADGYPLSATFEIAPVQDLHGYDNPWPGGGGKNILKLTDSNLKSLNDSGTWNGDVYTINSVAFTILKDGAGNIIGIKVHGQASANATFKLMDESMTYGANEMMFKGCPADGSNSTYAFALWRTNLSTVYDTGSGLSLAAAASNLRNNFYICIFSGYNANNLIFYPMFIKQSDASIPFQPYENKCPITGWTGCKPTATGKNLFDGEFSSGHYIKKDDGTIGDNNYYKYSTTYTKVKPETSYVLTGTDMFYASGNRSVVVFYYDKDKHILSYSQDFSSAPCVFSTPANTKYVRINFGKNATSVQFEEGSTATTYEAFGTTLDISFPAGAGTVYGGILTVNKDGTGGLGSNGIYATFNGSESWEVAGTAGTDYTYFRLRLGTYGTIETEKIISDLFPYADIAGSTTGIGIGCYNWESHGAYIKVRPSNVSSFADANAFKSWLSDNNINVVYWSTSTTEYELDVDDVGQICSVKGINNLYCDTGDVLEVDYAADTKLYVDGQNDAEDAVIADVKDMIADSDSMVTTEAHAQGDVFICDNKLLRALSAIASGASITIGTNAEVINLADYIAEKATDIATVQNNVDLLEEKAIALGMTPLNRAIFTNYQKNVKLASSGNLRYVDVLYNVFRSTGNISLSGSTYYGMIFTSNGVKTMGRLDQTPTLYKSYFRQIPKPIYDGTTWKLVVHVSQFSDKGTSGANTPQFYFFTYDSELNLYKVQVSASYITGEHMKGYSDSYFVMPDDFMANENICAGMNHRSPKPSFERKVEFMYVDASLLPANITTLTLVTVDTTVQDDPT